MVGYSHSGQRSMDSGATSLHRDDGVEDSDGGLEGLEILVLVREDTEMVVVHPQTNARVDVLLRGLEPRIPLSLSHRSVSERTEEIREGAPA